MCNGSGYMEFYLEVYFARLTEALVLGKRTGV